MKRKTIYVFILLFVGVFCFNSCVGDDDIEAPEYHLKPKDPEQESDNKIADEAFDAFNKAYLVSEKGLQYYRETLISNEKDYFWGQALDIQMAEDVYWRTKNPSQAILIKNLLNTFIKQNVGTTPPGEWGWNDFNDDILWAGLAFARGYQITNEELFRQKAEYAFNLMYDRGWDTELGGGIWWRQLPINEDERSKSALSNSPAVILGCYLYEFTENNDYLIKSTKISEWLLKTLYRNQDGGVYENIKATGVLSDYGNVYTNGAFVEAMAYMHKITGDNKYYDAAQKASDFVKDYRTTNGIIASHRYNGTWQSEYLRGVGNFIRENNLWDVYYSWLRKNADAAWSKRRTDLNLTWNDWRNPTDPNDNEMKPLEALGGVVVQQIMPLKNPLLEAGKEYQIKLKADSSQIIGKSDSKIILVKENGGNVERFKIVVKGYGYYQLESTTSSGMVLTIDGTNIIYKKSEPDNDNQLWKLIFDNRECHKLKPKKAPLKCLAYQNSILTLIKEEHSDNERWMFRE
ncbi:glycoside hydrolase family 76 protein [Dysgonomonas sp. BGC7]|uniref:glycoside hydrolase family 76 protein n=1 Tax=Dysgonomonas sp. BGC7 TaxID=1658008 RepID=UPI0009E26197|nr:glycoside hydrolase family 76 protein [Dysgonomonas sp. BGC7]MBD8389138.1 hypothetical protein [Dysgonomonas sp. BGC7]